MRVAFYSPTGLPMLMNPTNFNHCAIEFERVVDSLNMQINSNVPNALELRAKLKDYIEVRDAFRVLATLRSEN